MLNNKVKDIWNANAEFWDSKMGDGNVFHKTLIEPVQIKLLDIKAGDRILDIACGNGQFARKMAELGAMVTAIDFSEKFIAIARSKSPRNIDFRVVDAASDTDLEKLTGVPFDSIVCTMALMDMERVDVLADHLPKMLRPGGAFVFSILHPCFNSGESMLVHERDDSGGEVQDRYYVKTGNYLIENSRLGVGIKGQPEAQFYFHRPVSTILGYFFKNGFVLDGFDEPSFVNIENSTSIYDNVYKHIPPALICRLRLLNSAK